MLALGHPGQLDVDINGSGSHNATLANASVAVNLLSCLAGDTREKLGRPGDEFRLTP